MSEILTYSELIAIPDFNSRYEYLKLSSDVGKDTFGFDRYLNQNFYTSPRWRSVRNEIILRDNGCDLAHEDYPIPDKIYIHHLNPITKEDILKDSELLTNPEFLVCVSFATHNAIHYGTFEALVSKSPIERRPNDTCPWKK